MSSDQVKRYLETEKLYRKILDLIPEATIDKVGDSYVRGLLDSVLAIGKVEGRLTAVIDTGEDRLIEDWRRIASGDVPRETSTLTEELAYPNRAGQAMHISQSIIPVLRVLAYAVDPMDGEGIAQAARKTYPAVYPHLRRLVDHGWATTFRQLDRGSRRVYYRMTPDGRTQARSVLNESR